MPVIEKLKLPKLIARNQALFCGVLFMLSQSALANLPGAQPLPAQIQERIQERLAERLSNGYEPRGVHRNPDQSPKYSNRLLLTNSPYLLQHAHNPVNWYPWGEEAFQAAREQNRLILLSVGYSTCHWCHVMEEESFEELAIARILNERYIAIKVDREQRPDIDTLYMTAVQMLTGRGGWPMTVWLLPNGQPIYGGTYFPARNGERGVEIGFLSLLHAISNKYTEQPDAVEEYGKDLANALISEMQSPAASGTIPPLSVVDRALEYYRQNFDEFYGGLNRSPKFPSNLPIRVLTRGHLRTGDPELLEMATLTLEKMAAGGLFDQLGGGFHRYSTDPEWLVPHFEKMLYDNAQLAIDYLDVYQLTGRRELATTVRRILDYISREMRAASGGFYSATDADSDNLQGEREEGWFFTWTVEEILAALPPPQANAVISYYGMTATGNFEGRNILHRATPAADVARQLQIDLPELDRRIAQANKTLLTVRSRRPKPLLDDKILTAWNGLMISAYARAAIVLDEPAYRTQAIAAAKFILSEMLVESQLFRNHHSGQAQVPGFLDDYAFFIAGLLDLFEADPQSDWLRLAIELQQQVENLFADSAGGFYRTPSHSANLLVREKSALDGAEPSANGVTLMNLLRLEEWTGKHSYRQQAERLIESFAKAVNDAPMNYASMLIGLEFYHARVREVVVAMGTDRAQMAAIKTALQRHFWPHKIVVQISDPKHQQELEPHIPWLAGKTPRFGETTAYVCERGVCQLPTTDDDVFIEQMSGN